ASTTAAATVPWAEGGGWADACGLAAGRGAAPVAAACGAGAGRGANLGSCDGGAACGSGAAFAGAGFVGAGLVGAGWAGTDLGGTASAERALRRGVFFDLPLAMATITSRRPSAAAPPPA